MGAKIGRFGADEQVDWRWTGAGPFGLSRHAMS
jgi:hypothetical protein